VTVATERIERLDALARAATARGEGDLARSYVRLGRRIAERNRLDPPARFRRAACDACDAYRIPGRNARVRLQDGHVVWTCGCGAQDRYGY
jgi:ribonuclease P protein subunit RPR2